MHRYHHHPMLGTDVTLAIDGVEPGIADAVDRAVTAEIARLEAILTAFDPASEFERWKRGEVARPSDELTAVLAAAREWQARSGGVFNPLVGEIAALWLDGERRGAVPATDALTEAADRIAEPRLMVDGDGQVSAIGDVGALRLHAFAKGWIVDRALSAGLAAFEAISAESGVDADSIDVVVNAGGDLAHRGGTPQSVAIANPLSRFDNSPPIDRVMVGNAGLATSGRTRQGFDIDGHHYSHVIDPRTGRPVDLHASISIVASDAATADAVATIAGVCPTDEAIEKANDYESACLVVTLDGTLVSNERWNDLRPTSGPTSEA